MGGEVSVATILSSALNMGAGRGLIRRERADAILTKIVAAAESINTDPVMMHWIVRLSVFGSYLTDKAVLGDLDVAFDRKGRWGDGEGMELMDRYFVGHYPPPRYIRENYIERLFWPERVALRRLRVGRNISFHDHSEVDLLGCPTRTIYTFQAPADGMKLFCDHIEREAAHMLAT